MSIHFPTDGKDSTETSYGCLICFRIILHILYFKLSNRLDLFRRKRTHVLKEYL